MLARSRARPNLPPIFSSYLRVSAFKQFVRDPKMRARYMQITQRSLRRLWRWRLRSALIVLSAAAGVAGVVCPVNYGAGGARQLLDQVRRMGTNVLVITPAQDKSV